MCICLIGRHVLSLHKKGIELKPSSFTHIRFSTLFKLLYFGSAKGFVQGSRRSSMHKYFKYAE